MHFLRILFSIVFILLANNAMAAYTFPGAMPSGCTGTSNSYTCNTSVNLNDHVNFTDSGNVTITINGNLTIGAYTIGSSNDTANVTFIVNGSVSISSPTIYANISSGAYSINTTATAAIYGNLNSTSGSIIVDGFITGNVASTTGTIDIRNGSSINGHVTSTSGLLLLRGNNRIYANVSCSTCNFTISSTGNRIDGTITVGSLTDGSPLSSPGTIYNNAITALTGDAIVGYYATVNGNVTAKRNIQIRNFANVTGNITTNNVSGNTEIEILNDASVNGNISATASSIYNTYVFVFERITVNGSITTYTPDSSEVRIYTTSTVNGDITAFGGDSSTVYIWGTVVGNVQSTSTDVNDGNLYLWANATVSGSVYVSSNIYNYGTVTGCAQTVDTGSGHHVYLYSGSSTYATCKGTSSCSTDTSYVWKDSSITMPPLCTFTATNIAKYHFDETAFNGTLNETKDTAGYTGGPFDGQGIGSPFPTAMHSDRAIAGSTGTCGYATLSGPTSGGSAFTLDNLPVSTSNNSKTSISFWAFWNGTDTSVIVGWNLYAFYLSPGRVAFSTGNADGYGVSRNDLANGWHHYAVVFNNGNYNSNQLYIDGVKQTLSQLNGTQETSRAVVQSTLQIGGWTYNSDYRFNNGRVDEVKVYNGAVTQAQVTADYNATHLCPTYVTNINANRFNCIAEQETNVNTGKLYTQIAGNPFNIKVIALKADGTAETSFSAASDRTAVLRFKDQVTNTTINFSGGETVNSKNVLFTTANNTGIVPVTGITIPQAYKNLRCEVSEGAISASPSSDNFSVRPQIFTLSTNVTSPHIAGNDFRLTATGGTGYTGTPKLFVSRMNNVISPDLLNYTLTNTNNAYVYNSSNNIFTSGNGFATLDLRFHDVGYIQIEANAVVDQDFTAVDSPNDCQFNKTVNTLSSGKYGCDIGSIATANIGRFKPDHFTVTTNTLTAGCASGGFTYMDEPKLALNTVIQAQSLQNLVAKSYNTGVLNFSVRNNTTDLNKTRLQKSNTAWSPSSTWVDGELSISENTLSFIKNPTTPSLDGPYEAFNINHSITDSLGDSISFIGNTSTNNIKVRYGRLSLKNAYGSELLPLSIPIEAQYWDGTTYRRNTLDSCTNTTTPNITLSNYKKNLNAGETTLAGGGLMNEGKSSFTLSKPGAGNSGTVDLTFSLTNFPWMGTDDPVARATFGLYKSPIIYMRENY